jgi:hypothetical protein
MTPSLTGSSNLSRRPALTRDWTEHEQPNRLIVATVGGVIGGAAALALAAHYQTLQPPVVNLNLVTVVRPTAPAAPIDSMPARNAIVGSL